MIAVARSMLLLVSIGMVVLRSAMTVFVMDDLLRRLLFKAGRTEANESTLQHE